MAPRTKVVSLLVGYYHKIQLWEGVTDMVLGFWNYFQHGLDFLIVDGTVHKIQVHSNIVS